MNFVTCETIHIEFLSVVGQACSQDCLIETKNLSGRALNSLNIGL